MQWHFLVAQNDGVDYGSCRYLRGAKLSVADPSAFTRTATAAFKKMAELSQGMHRYMVSFEYVSMAKVLEVSNSAMAFSGRGSDLNVLTVCTWPGDANTPENEKKAKEGVTAFSKIVEADGDGSGSIAEPRAYGNYCKCHHFTVSLFSRF